MKTFEQEMKELKRLYKECKVAEFNKKAQEILEAYPSEEHKGKLLAMVRENQQNALAEIDELQNKVTIYSQLEEYKEIIPMSYIARTYFGKTPAWLQQRISGYKVRGKVYSLKPHEVDTLNLALHEIGNRLGSLAVHL